MDFHIDNFLLICNCITLVCLYAFPYQNMKFHITKILKEIITFNLYFILKNYANRESTESLKIIENQEKLRKTKKNRDKTKTKPRISKKNQEKPGKTNYAVAL